MLVIGIDIEPGTSPRAPEGGRYTVAVMRDGELEAILQNLKLIDVLQIVNRRKVNYLAVDNPYELAADSRDLLRVLRKLPYNTRLVCPTWSMKHGFRQLRRIAAEHGIQLSQKPSPEEAAVAIAKLASLGVGGVIDVRLGYTRIKIARCKSPKPGGSSSARWGRKLAALCQSVVREITSVLSERGFDFDAYYRRATGGLRSAVINVYSTDDFLLRIPRLYAVDGVSIEVYRPFIGGLVIRPLQEEQEEKHRRPVIVGIDAGMTTGLCISALTGEVLVLESYKHASRVDILQRIMEVGEPVLFAVDVPSPPASVMKLASAFGVKVFRPDRPLSTREKAEVCEKTVSRKMLSSKPRNAHERDALAAVVKALDYYSPAFERAEARVREVGVTIPIDVIRTWVIQGKPVDSLVKKWIKVPAAVELPTPSEKHEKKAHEGEEARKLKEEVMDMRRLVRALEVEVGKLKEENQQLRERIYGFKKEIEKEIELKKLRGLLREYQQKVSLLQAKIAQLEKQVEEERKLQLELGRKRVFLAKYIPKLTRRHLVELLGSVGLSNGDVLCVGDGAGAGKLAVCMLSDYNPQIVAFFRNMPPKSILSPLIQRKAYICEIGCEVGIVRGHLALLDDSEMKVIMEAIEKEAEKKSPEKILTEIVSEYRRKLS